MYRNPTPYIPMTNGEIRDLLARMMFGAPTFVDKTGHFDKRSIDTEFFALNEGLKEIRNQLGEGNYRVLAELSALMRAHFEADPEDKTEDGVKGRECIVKMRNILRAAEGRKRRALGPQS